MIRAGELLAVVLAAGTVTRAAGLWWFRRRLRRLRRLGAAAAARADLAAAGTVAARLAARHRLWSLPLPDRRWLAAARERRRLWRTVGAAGRAVTAARQAGAPAGDLDGLCRQLRHAAGDASRRVPLPGQAAAEINNVLQAAGQIQEAAASATAVMARPAARHLAEDARREAAGIAAAGLAGHRR